MKWMDEVGCDVSDAICWRDLRYRADGQVNFKRPIPVGDTALIEAFVYDTGKPLKSGSNIEKTNGETGLTAESYSVYVAVDEDRNSVPVPDVTTELSAVNDCDIAALTGKRPLILLAVVPDISVTVGVAQLSRRHSQQYELYSAPPRTTIMTLDVETPERPELSTGVAADEYDDAEVRATNTGARSSPRPGRRRVGGRLRGMGHGRVARCRRVGHRHRLGSRL